MVLSDENIHFIKNAFDKMKSKQDLLKLLNYAKSILHDNTLYPFDLQQINYHCNPKHNRERYISFIIKKKSGSDRIIHSPNKGLKKIQQCLNIIFQAVYNDVSPFANGFVSGKSIVDNAISHTEKNYVYNIDLKDFFYSIDQARIWGRLQYPPFNLNIKKNRLELANIIASLCCHNIEVERFINNEWTKKNLNVLPQGAPTSPILTNIICQKLDFLLSSTAKHFNLSYSRYADDITFSSMHNVYQPDSDFLIEIERIIRSQNFNIKESKTRLQVKYYRQEVTGIVVNSGVNVKLSYIKELRKWIYYCENYGFDRASSYFLPKYTAEKKTTTKEFPSLISIIAGKLDYLKMVKGEENNTYLKLRKRFNVLIENSFNKLTIEQEREEEVYIDSPSVLVNIMPLSTASIPIYHRPQTLVSILKKFSTNNSVLKYTTHSWDGGKDEDLFTDLQDFLSKIKSEFNKISGLKSLNDKLWAKCLSFLLNKNVDQDGWGVHRIKFGWSSPELLEAMEKDPNLKPENFVIPEYAQFKLPTNRGVVLIQRFKQVIDIFKNEIEIRDENSVLMELILQFHDKYIPEFNIIEIKNLENKNFYTDVDYLEKAFSLIFQNIQIRNNYPNVSYIMKEETDKYILEILHHDSFAVGKSIFSEKLNLISGDMSIIKNRLINLCDWSVESKFTEGAYRINYLVSSKDIVAYERIDEVDGFKYILTFYK